MSFKSDGGCGHFWCKCNLPFGAVQITFLEDVLLNLSHTMVKLKAFSWAKSRRCCPVSTLVISIGVAGVFLLGRAQPVIPPNL